MEHQELIAAWKKQANSKTNTATHFLFYVLARGIVAEKHPQTYPFLKKAFGPVVNKNKRLNGRYPYDTLEQLLYSFQQSPNTYWYNQRPIIKTTSKELGIEIDDFEEEAIRTLAMELLVALRQEDFYKQNLQYKRELRNAKSATLGELANG